MKTVLIQGAAGGIGGALVRALLSRPDVDRVVATARDSELRPELLATPEAHPERIRDMCIGPSETARGFKADFDFR
jgi:NAD(P)-dependent dehydrogenase (short-subunit alcohol dehydrogenase family)